MTVVTRVHTISPPSVLVSRAARRGPHDLRRIVIRSAGDIYIGGPDVDETTGLFLSAGDRFEVDQSTGDDIYIIPAADNTQVTTLETRSGAFGFQISKLAPLDPEFGDYWQAANGHTGQFSAEGLWVAIEPTTDNICVLLGNQLLWLGPEET